MWPRSEKHFVYSICKLQNEGPTGPKMGKMNTEQAAMQDGLTPSVNRGCLEQEVSTQRDNFELQCLTLALISVLLLVHRVAEW